MNVILTKELAALVDEKVRSGRYLDESEVIREALRLLEQRDDFEPFALEVAMLEGVRSEHRRYDPTVREEIRKSTHALSR